MVATKIELETELVLADYTLIYPRAARKVYLPEMDFELTLQLEPGLYEIVTSSLGNNGPKLAKFTVSTGVGSVTNTARADQQGRVAHFFQFIIQADGGIEE